MLMKRISVLLCLFISACVSLYAQMGAQTLKTPWIIKDNFSNNDHNWYEDSTKSYEIRVRDNYYGLQNKDSAGRIFVHNFTQGFEADDYKIEALIEPGSGAESKGNGLVFGADPLLKNYYRFLVSKDGAFMIDKISNDGKTLVQDWKYANAIRTGTTNALSIVKFGNHWTFRINDFIVYSGDATSFFGNRHGFYVASFCTIYCNSFSIYDMTLAKKDTKTPKENIYDAVFLDYFNNNDNDWDITDNDDATTSLDGSFNIKHKTDGYYVSWQTMPISDLMNHRIEIKAKHTAGVEDYPYGICFGMKDIDNIYFFGISADGSFLIGEFVDGEYQRINPWTESDAVYKNYGAINTLAVEKTDKWYFYINGTQVYSCDYKSYFGNKFGLYVENQQTVEFTNVKLSRVTVF